jgi:carbon monoxide dehydrogenase subunit G
VKVQIEKTFPMPASADIAWRLLQDIEATAACMPGAKVTERLDERHYKGTVTIRVGPATLSFKGDIEVKELDPTTRTLRLVGKGSDTSGTSAASLDLTARTEAAEDGLSNLVGRSEASVSGKAASFGGRMMDSVADQLLKQFAANFAARVEALAVQQASGTAAETGKAGETPVAPPPPHKELNGLALLWAIVWDWLRGLFSKKPA